MAQLDSIEQGIIEGKKHRALQHHGETTTHGIDLVLTVELHRSPLLRLPIVFVDDLQFLDPGLQLLHRLHGFIARLRQRPEGYFDEKGGQHDRHTVIVYQAIEQAKELQHGARQRGEEPQIDELIERGLSRLE